MFIPRQGKVERNVTVAYNAVAIENLESMTSICNIDMDMILLLPRTITAEVIVAIGKNTKEN